MGKMRNACRILVEFFKELNRPHGRPRPRWDYNRKMDCEGVDWIRLA